MNQISDIKPSPNAADEIEQKIVDLIGRMTLDEKIGQLHQLDGTVVDHDLFGAVRAGVVGSLLNQVDPDANRELQRVAVEESRLGIPLIIARDVIHGFKTVFPLPIGQAASWNLDLARDGARIAAEEAAQTGVSWTFAPMLDISRDARWGRIAESFGEDPFLTSAFGAACTEGFQGDDLSDPTSLAACAKHFAGYGAAEGGRDYAATNIPPNELRNIYLPPFKAAVEAGIATVMSSFSDMDGVPAHANAEIIRGYLRGKWHFDGIHVSDWDAVRELCTHGVAQDVAHAAEIALNAGIDVEMVGGAFSRNLTELLHEDRITMATLEEAVANVLRIKFRLGLFDDPYARIKDAPVAGTPNALAAAKEAATESFILLKNEGGALPLNSEALAKIAVIGPTADTPAEQLGTWVFDGDPGLSVTPLQAMRDQLDNQAEILHSLGLRNTIDRSTDLFDDAVKTAEEADVTLLFLGEDAILSGEAHCRADITLPGEQVALLEAVVATGKPVVAIVIAGRPLVMPEVLEEARAVLFGFHPGSMTGPALYDLIFGLTSPSGRLPVTFPTAVGQIPIYYNHKNSGRPGRPDRMAHIDSIEVGSPQTSLGMSSFYLDEGYQPALPFGFGLTYSYAHYEDLQISDRTVRPGAPITVSAMIRNTGDVAIKEVVQLYIQDIVGSVSRPVRELKGFEKVSLAPGEARRVSFEIGADDLAFYRRDLSFGNEPGRYHVWIAPNAHEGLRADFRFEDV